MLLFIMCTRYTYIHTYITDNLITTIYSIGIGCCTKSILLALKCCHCESNFRKVGVSRNGFMGYRAMAFFWGQQKWWPGSKVIGIRVSVGRIVWNCTGVWCDCLWCLVNMSCCDAWLVYYFWFYCSFQYFGQRFTASSFILFYFLFISCFYFIWIWPIYVLLSVQWRHRNENMSGELN